MVGHETISLSRLMQDSMLFLRTRQRAILCRWGRRDIRMLDNVQHLVVLKENQVFMVLVMLLLVHLIDALRVVSTPIHLSTRYDSRITHGLPAQHMDDRNEKY